MGKGIWSPHRKVTVPPGVQAGCWGGAGDVHHLGPSVRWEAVRAGRGWKGPLPLGLSDAHVRPVYTDKATKVKDASTRARRQGLSRRWQMELCYMFWVWFAGESWVLVRGRNWTWASPLVMWESIYPQCLHLEDRISTAILLQALTDGCIWGMCPGRVCRKQYYVKMFSSWPSGEKIPNWHSLWLPAYCSQARQQSGWKSGIRSPAKLGSMTGSSSVSHMNVGK